MSHRSLLPAVVLAAMASVPAFAQLRELERRGTPPGSARRAGADDGLRARLRRAIPPPAARDPALVQHDFLFLGEEAFLEPAGEVETRLRLGARYSQAPTVTDNRSPTLRRRVTRRREMAATEVEWGLAPGFELELESALRRDRTVLPHTRTTTDWGVGESELGLRWSPWEHPRFALTGGLALVMPEGAGAADRSRTAGGEGSLALSRDLGPLTFHARLAAEYRPGERPRDLHGAVARDAVGQRLDAGPAWEYEGQAALAAPLWGRRLWLQGEYEVERELGTEPLRHRVAPEWEHLVAAGAAYYFLSDSRADAEQNLRFKLGGAATFAWGEGGPAWGFRLQVQLEFE